MNFADLKPVVTVLSPEAWDELQRLLDAPPEPNENLKRLAQTYRDEVAAGRLKVEDMPA